MSIFNKITQLLEIKGGTQKALTDYLGLDKTTFSAWKNGKSKSYEKNIPQIAEYFDVPISYFYDENDNNFQMFSKDEINLIKLYRSLTTSGQKEALRHINNIADMEASEEFFPTCKVKHSIFEVSAGVGAEIGDYDEWDYIEVLKTPDSVKADFCLTIKGDSMQPMFDNGDIILVRDQPVVDVGQICVYNINNNGYVKKFGGNKLISLNPEYDDIEIPNQDDNIVKCCGLVLGKATVFQ